MARKPVFNTPLGRRLSEVRDELGYAEDRQGFADLFALKADTYGSYERGKNEPKADFYATLRDGLGVNLNWLFSGQGQMFEDPGKKPAAPVELAADTAQRLVTAMQSMTQAANSLTEMQESAEDTVKLPVYAIKAAAGHGAAVLDEQSTGSISFTRAFLRAFGVQPRDAMMLDAKGDSMYPTIPDAAHMLVNRKDKRWTNDRIYVARIDGDIVVKRVKKVGRAIELISDNPAFETRRLEAADLESVEALGRVFFVMQEL